MSIDPSSLRKTQAAIEKAMNIHASSLEQGLDEIGLRGVGILKRNTPKISGRLRASNSFTRAGFVTAPLNPQSSSDKLNPTLKKKEVFIGSNVIYAAKVEFDALDPISRGYMSYSYRTLKPMANGIMQKVYKKRGF